VPLPHLGGEAGLGRRWVVESLRIVLQEEHGAPTQEVGQLGAHVAGGADARRVPLAMASESGDLDRPLPFGVRLLGRPPGPPGSERRASPLLERRAASWQVEVLARAVFVEGDDHRGAGGLEAAEIEEIARLAELVELRVRRAEDEENPRLARFEIFPEL